MTLTVYHVPPTRSVRIVWALEELGLPYELKRMSFEDVRKPEWRAVSPTGKVPVVFDDGKALVESVAITHYVSERYAAGRLSRRPIDPDYAEFLQWMHFGEAGMGPYGGMLIAHTRLLPPDQRSEGMKQWAMNETRNACAFLEQSLGDKPFILGTEFSLADISLGYMLHLIRLSGESKNLFPPQTMAYYGRLLERPAFKAALA